MSRGDSIRQRANGSWEARYYVEGHRKSVYGATYREVSRKLRDAKSSAERGEKAPDLRRSTAAWLETWLAADVRPRLRPQTVTSYEGTVARYIVPVVGKVPVAKLDVDDVTRVLATMEADGLSARTRQLALTVLRIALNRAVEAGVATRNVAKIVKAPRQDRPQRQPFTAEQVAALIDETRDGPIGPLVVLSATTGLRQGEALALRWDDVDLDAAEPTLTVRHTLDPKTRQIGLTKTELSRRTIVLPAVAVAALREQQQRQRYDRLRGKRHEAGFVFATRAGTPMDARNVDRLYHAARERRGLPNLPWHHLRHFAATALLEAEEELFVVSRILGHASISTTAAFYSHVRPSMLRRSADRMDEVMRKASGG